MKTKLLIGVGVIIVGVGFLYAMDLVSFKLPDNAGVPKERREENDGVLQGKVSVGPICPVERADVPCPVPPEAYTSRTIVVLDSSGKKEVTARAISYDGTYAFTLPAGRYILDIRRQGIDHSGELPHPFTITAGETLVFDFSIDTGIR